MNQFYFLCLLLFCIVVTITTANVGLQTQQGVIYGRQTQISIEYLGIQYARVTRWKPPVDLATEMFPDGSLNATSFGPCCPQGHRVDLPVQDEQCLYLNIYKPIVPSNHSLLPVFVWIHGGAHKGGCSSAAIPKIYNGTNMIANSPPDQPVIIITINYRLGALADMYLEELIEEDPEWPTAGNYMYLDMLSALRWVSKNIRDYGGDPSNISIFGQSAGGLSVTDLGAVKGSANLYRTALSQSALDPPGTYSAYYNASVALNYSNGIVERLNCINEDKQKLLACMRNASTHDLFRAYGDRYTRPIIDSYFFPLYPPLAIRNGSYNNITLVMGHNNFEQAICVTHPDMNYNQALELINQTIRAKWLPFLVDYYHLNDCSADRTANITRCCDMARRILLDQLFECDIRRIFDAFYFKYGPAYENNKLYSYHLNCYPTCPIVEPRGVCQHSSELPFVFGTESDAHSLAPINCTWDNQTREFSNGIISHWTNVATTGRPLSSWPSYDPSTPKYFHITPDQGFSTETWDRNCSFFDQMEAEGVQETFRHDTFIVKIA